MCPEVSCVKGLVLNMWYKMEKVGLRGKKLGHWRHAIDTDADIPSLPVALFLSTVVER